VALIVTYAIVQGITDLVYTFKRREEVSSQWFWIHVLGGIVQLIFAIWMIFQPIFGGLTLIAVIGIYTIFLGITLIVRAFNERSGGSSGLEATA